MRSNFYSGDYDKAIAAARKEYKKSGSKDRLVWLLEAGVILHTQGKYQASNEVFQQAEVIARTIKTSISRTAASFLLNDRTTNFKGESYERVLIYFYMALNSLFMGDFRESKRYLRKLDYEHREMKFGEDIYRQNIMARYLDALVSEYLGKYNDAQVQYRNIMNLQENSPLAADGLVMARKSDRDTALFNKGADDLLAFNSKLKRRKYNPEMGELVIINQGGKAARKFSRGKVIKNDAFYRAAHVATGNYLSARASAQVLAAGFSSPAGAALAVMGGMMASVENPIPEYKQEDDEGVKPLNISINNEPVGKTLILNDYSKIAIKNFNDNYSKYVAKNVTSVVIKFAAAYLAAKAIAHAAEKQASKKGYRGAGQVVGFLAGAGAGVAIAKTIKPDLRCWTLLPSNFQARRIFLEPGRYTLTFDSGSSSVPQQTVDVEIKKGQVVFLGLRTLRGLVKYHQTTVPITKN